MIGPQTAALASYSGGELVFVAGFAVYVAIRHVYEKRARGIPKLVSRLDRTEILLLGLVSVGSVLLPLLYLLTPWLRRADVTLPGWATAGGVVVMPAALALFWRSHADLGPSWSPTLELRRDHRLVTRGVYARVRHPMYAAIFLFGVAQGLLLGNWIAGWSALATFAVMYAFRVRREERMLCEHFGEAYRDYMGRTGRLWPPLFRSSR